MSNGALCKSLAGINMGGNGYSQMIRGGVASLLVASSWRGGWVTGCLQFVIMSGIFVLLPVVFIFLA
jgi:hypothetical protein